jgi:hypothetical protein
MAGQLLPPPELAPPTPERLTPTQRIETWLDLMDTCEQFLLAGLRRSLGPEGDVTHAHRQWYVEQMAEHDRTMERLVKEFDRRWSNRAR